MFILTFGFDFVLFSSNPDLNLWRAAWLTDIWMGFVAFVSATLYFKNRILSFSLFLVILFSMAIFPFMSMWTKDLTTVVGPELKGNYAINQFYYRGHENIYILDTEVYKEIFPFVYKLTDSISESVSEIDDREIVASFKERKYKISDDGKTLSYGRIRLSLE